MFIEVIVLLDRNHLVSAFNKVSMMQLVKKIKSKRIHFAFLFNEIDIKQEILNPLHIVTSGYACKKMKLIEIT